MAEVLAQLGSDRLRRDRLRRKAVGALFERLDQAAADEASQRLVGGWLAGGCTAVETCLDSPGPLAKAWARAGEGALTDLMLEFTFPMISRWFRYIRGAQDGLPADRLERRLGWFRYVISVFSETGLEKRLAIQTRFDALFNSESEANMRARASPSVMGLIPPSSLLPTQAAQLANSHLRGFHESSWNRLGMSVVKGQVSVSESYVLGMRALGLRGRLARFNPRWDQPTSVPVRPPPPDAAQIPASVWSISAALLLVQPLDVGMGTMFQRLRSFPADGVSLGPPRP